MAGHPTVVDAMYVLAVTGLVQQIGNLSPVRAREPGGRIKSQHGAKTNARCHARGCGKVTFGPH